MDVGTRALYVPLPIDTYQRVDVECCGVVCGVERVLWPNSEEPLE